MVASVLGTVYAPGRLAGDASELNDVLRRLCASAEWLLMTGKECSLRWEVPFTSSGEKVTVTIEGHIVSALAGTTRSLIEPLVPIRLWEPASHQLNQTMLDELDSTARRVSFGSGEVIELSTLFVTVEDEARLLVFCTGAG